VVRGHFPDSAFAMTREGDAKNRGKANRFKVRLRFVADPSSGSITLAGIE
jgi:hypothetical protein